jgi:hypothetical protein
MAIRPDTKIRTDRTPAKIGRSMKNLDRFMLGARQKAPSINEASSARLPVFTFARALLAGENPGAGVAR